MDRVIEIKSTGQAQGPYLTLIYFSDAADKIFDACVGTCSLALDDDLFSDLLPQALNKFQSDPYRIRLRSRRYIAIY